MLSVYPRLRGCDPVYPFNPRLRGCDPCVIRLIRVSVAVILSVRSVDPRPVAVIRVIRVVRGGDPRSGGYNRRTQEGV